MQASGPRRAKNTICSDDVIGRVDWGAAMATAAGSAGTGSVEPLAGLRWDNYLEACRDEVGLALARLEEDGVAPLASALSPLGARALLPQMAGFVIRALLDAGDPEAFELLGSLGFSLDPRLDAEKTLLRDAGREGAPAACAGLCGLAEGRQGQRHAAMAIGRSMVEVDRKAALLDFAAALPPGAVSWDGSGGWELLGWAAQCGSWGSMESLIRLGADPQLCDVRGMDPFEGNLPEASAVDRARVMAESIELRLCVEAEEPRAPKVRARSL